MKSDSARSSGSVSGPPTRSSIEFAQRPVVPVLTEGSSSRRPRAGGPPRPGSRTRSRARPRPGRSSRARRSRRSRRAVPRPRAAATSARAAAPGAAGSLRLTDRIIIRTYSAIGRLNTPRALVTTRPRSRDAGVRARSTPDVAEWTQARLRGTDQQPVEGLRASASHGASPRHRRAVRRPVPRSRPSPDARPAPPPGSARGRASDSVPRGSDSGRSRSGRRPARCPVRRSGRGLRVRSCDDAPSRTRRIQRAGSSISPSRGSVSGPSHSRASAADPRASAIARTNRSPFLYCSILRSIPVRRRTARSNGVRRVRRSWNRALMRSTSGTRSLADLVHHVVAEPFEEAHHGLGLAEEARAARAPSAAPSSGRRRCSPRRVRPETLAPPRGPCRGRRPRTA